MRSEPIVRQAIRTSARVAVVVAGSMILGVAAVAAEPPPPSAAAANETAEHQKRCLRLSDDVRKHIAMVKGLEQRKQGERVAPPTSLKRAWERMTGAPEDDQPLTQERLIAEREKVAVLNTGLIANSCPPVDPATVKPADMRVLPTDKR